MLFEENRVLIKSPPDIVANFWENIPKYLKIPQSFALLLRVSRKSPSLPIPGKIFRFLEVYIVLAVKKKKKKKKKRSRLSIFVQACTPDLLVFSEHNTTTWDWFKKKKQQQQQLGSMENICIFLCAPEDFNVSLQGIYLKKEIA